MKNVFSNCTFKNMKIQFISLFMKKRIVPTVMSEEEFITKMVNEGIVNRPEPKSVLDPKINERKRKMLEVVRKYDQTVTEHK